MHLEGAARRVGLAGGPELEPLHPWALSPQPPCPSAPMSPPPNIMTLPATPFTSQGLGKTLQTIPLRPLLPRFTVLHTITT